MFSFWCWPAVDRLRPPGLWLQGLGGPGAKTGALICGDVPQALCRQCAQSLSCVRLCDPMDCRPDCSPPDSSVHGDSPGKNTGMGCHALLQDLPNPGIKPRSPTFQVDSLPSEPPGKPLGRVESHSELWSECLISANLLVSGVVFLPDLLFGLRCFSMGANRLVYGLGSCYK